MLDISCVNYHTYENGVVKTDLEILHFEIGSHCEGSWSTTNSVKIIIQQSRHGHFWDVFLKTQWGSHRVVLATQEALSFRHKYVEQGWGGVRGGCGCRWWWWMCGGGVGCGVVGWWSGGGSWRCEPDYTEKSISYEGELLPLYSLMKCYN